MAKTGVVGNLIVRVGADLSGFSSGMKKVQKDLASASKSLGKVGSSLTKNVTLPAAAAVTGLAAIAVNAGKAADELLTLSAQTGISTDTLQGLKYASELVDVEIETMTKGLGKVTKAMGAASNKGNDYIELSDGLKVSIKDSNGHLKDSEQVFYDVVDALGQMKDETQREIAAQEIFGKSYQDIMPLIKAGSGALKQYTQEAKDMGLVMSQDQVEALGKFDDSMVRLKASLEVASNKIAIAMIPTIEKLIPVIQDKIVPAVIAFATNLGNVIAKFGEMDPKVQTMILTIGGLVVALGPLLSGASSLLMLGSTLAGLIGASGPITLVAAGLLGIAAAISAINAGIKDVKAGATTADIVKKQGVSNAVGNGYYLQNMSTTQDKAANAAMQAGSRYSAIPKLADGGIVTKPTLALVGEAGPEAVVPLGKGGITININGNMSSERDAKKYADAMVRELKLKGVYA